MGRASSSSLDDRCFSDHRCICFADCTGMVLQDREHRFFHSVSLHFFNRQGLLQQPFLPDRNHRISIRGQPFTSHLFPGCPFWQSPARRPFSCFLAMAAPIPDDAWLCLWRNRQDRTRLAQWKSPGSIDWKGIGRDFFRSLGQAPVGFTFLRLVRTVV